MTKNFWHNRDVLVTGLTGFKGSWLGLWLESLGANVTGISLDPPTKPNLFTEAQVSQGITSYHADVCDVETIKQIMIDVSPSVVFHLAAQSLVRQSYDNPIDTYKTNVMGTLCVLEAIRATDCVRSAIMVTTDKVYENREWVWAYRENDRMGGFDPYSSSKGAAELLISSYRNSYFPTEKYAEHQVSLASVRAGNVIGGGDWAADRLIPDIIKSLQNYETPMIRNPKAIRPWQHVLEPLYGYILLAEKMVESGENFSEAWNFGPDQSDTKPVDWIVDKMLGHWKQDSIWNKQKGSHPHEANFLRLDCSKVQQKLNWSPIWSLEKALEKIFEWTHEYEKSTSVREITLKQISQYMMDRDQVCE